MVVAIAVAITVLLILTGYALYLNTKLANLAKEQASVDSDRIHKAEALEDSKITKEQEDREQHVKETNASDLLNQLKLHARPSK